MKPQQPTTTSAKKFPPPPEAYERIARVLSLWAPELSKLPKEVATNKPA